MCIKKLRKKKRKKMGGDHRIGGLHVVVLGHIGGCPVVGGEREGGKCDKGSVVGDSQRWYM